MIAKSTRTVSSAINVFLMVIIEAIDTWISKLMESAIAATMKSSKSKASAQDTR